MIRMEMGSEMKNKLRKKKEDKGICMGNIKFQSGSRIVLGLSQS